MRRLQDICIVTHCVDDLDREVEAWCSLLGYRALQRAPLGETLCTAWGTPGDVGRASVLLGPASGAPTYVRLVTAPGRAGYWPPVTWGWNATEILVTDPDALAERLNGSDIRRFGGPGDLYDAPKAPRAIQTLSPAGAMLYFTRIQPGGSRYGLHGATSFVDRVFNVVLGGPDLDALRDFYGSGLGLRVSPPIPFTMTLAAQATNAPADALFPICVAPVRPRRSILELDEYPADTSPRPRKPGELPGGMSMVSFRVNNLDNLPVPLRAEPRRIPAAPYDNSRVAVIEGPAGEWLELIEARAD